MSVLHDTGSIAWVHCQTIVKTEKCACTFCVGIMAKIVLRNSLKKKNECLLGFLSELQSSMKGQFEKAQIYQFQNLLMAVNWLMTPGRCEPPCSGRGGDGSQEDVGRAPAGEGRQFVFDAAEELLASGGFKRQCLLAKVVGCDRMPDFVCGSCYSHCHLVPLSFSFSCLVLLPP